MRCNAYLVQKFQMTLADNWILKPFFSQLDQTGKHFLLNHKVLQRGYLCFHLRVFLLCVWERAIQVPPPLPSSLPLLNPGGLGGAFCPRAPVTQWYLWPRYCKITLYSAESMWGKWIASLLCDGSTRWGKQMRLRFFVAAEYLLVVRERAGMRGPSEAPL